MTVSETVRAECLSSWTGTDPNDDPVRRTFKIDLRRSSQFHEFSNFVPFLSSSWKQILRRRIFDNGRSDRLPYYDSFFLDKNFHNYFSLIRENNVITKKFCHFQLILLYHKIALFFLQKR